MNELFSSGTPAIVNSNRILYTASSFARSSLLHLQEIGTLEAKKSHTSSRSDLQSFLFFTVVSGSGTLTYNDKSYNLRAGSCVFIDCHNPYSHTTDEHNLWTIRWIHFYGPTMSNIYSKYCERGGKPVFRMASNDSGTSGNSGDVERVGFAEHREKIDRIDAVWKNLFATAGSNDYMRDMIINQQLSTLLILLMEESWHPEDQVSAKKKQSVLKIKEWIDENYSSKITLDQLSREFFINKYYLSKSFKEQFGQSLSSYIQGVRITKAKQLLRFSSKTVEEIGYECGLGAPHYFSQRFKEVEGVPPSKYREQW